MINDEINIVEDFLSLDECRSILNKCKEELVLSTAGVVNGNYKERKSSVAWIHDLGEINERLKSALRSHFNFGGMEVTGLGPFQFTEYKEGEYYGWHTDRDSVICSDRFVSTVIQLNDNYLGGILETKNSKGNLIPITHKIGNLYMFNSNLRHRVTPVEEGIRYSLVNWISIIKTDPSKQNLI